LPDSREIKDSEIARHAIIQAVNRFKLGKGRTMRVGAGHYAPKLFGMKQIQQAVFTARQNKLVDADTLRRAGFNPERRKR
jgi:hypothetical protein